MDLSQLLRSICYLDHLTFLSLPKGAVDSRARPRRSHISKHQWPARLEHLQINGFTGFGPQYWDDLLLGLPVTAHTLGLCRPRSTPTGRKALESMAWATGSAPQIKVLQVRHLIWDSRDFRRLCSTFPNLRSISLPYEFSALYAFGLSQQADPSETGPWAGLEELVIVDDAYDHPLELKVVEDALPVRRLTEIASKFPSFKRIEVPNCLYGSLAPREDVSEMQRLQADFVKRWPSEPESDVGVFLGCSIADAEPLWDEEATRRSLKRRA